MQRRNDDTESTNWNSRDYRNAVVHFHISFHLVTIPSCLRSLIKAPLPVVPSNWSAVMFSDPINPAP